MAAIQQFADVNGKRIAYLEAGSGDPIVLLHGNPTSSFLWRNIIPELEGCGRVIAPDLIGQGDSDKLPASEGPGRYSFEAAFDYLDGLLRSIGADQNVTLVIHDWGSGLGFHWARLSPESVKGIAYMEAIVTPVTWEDWPESARGIFKGFRSPRARTLCSSATCSLRPCCPAPLSESSVATKWPPIARPLIHLSIDNPR